LGLAPSEQTSSQEYKAQLKQLIRYIQGARKAIIRELEKEMKQAASTHNFEHAARVRNRIKNLRELQQRIMFGDKEFLDISKDVALNDLQTLFNLPVPLKRIEGFDVSHMGGTNVVASMVVFSNGVSDRSEYRKFKTKIDQNNDFYNMHETLYRRLSDKNLKAWGTPNLIIIDGGKGQLDAALQASNERQIHIDMIGLAKKQEQLVIKKQTNLTINTQKLGELKGTTTESDHYILIHLPHNSHVIKLLQRIRDESHRFAVSYHTVLKRQKQTASNLEKIPTIGPATRRKLIKIFGSVKAIQAASHEELVAAVGVKKSDVLRKYL
jgi:excinuclease ABC subunit C